MYQPQKTRQTSETEVVNSPHYCWRALLGTDRSNWTPHLVVKPVDSQSESKATREILNTCKEEEKPTILVGVLKKYSLVKTLRIGAWVKRFLGNSRMKTSQNRQHGSLTTDEIDQQRQWWIGKDPKFANDSTQLNIQADTNTILKCRGRVQGKFPIYLPDSSLFSMKLVEEAHLVTLHGEVILTTTKIREKFWIPRLRRLVKKSRKRCSRCKKFMTKPY